MQIVVAQHRQPIEEKVTASCSSAENGGSSSCLTGPPPPPPPPPPTSSSNSLKFPLIAFSATDNTSHQPSSVCSHHRLCRICLFPSESRRRPLISPCRCSGSVQHVHTHCLAHWIEVSSRKMPPMPRCELCGYRYRRKAFVDLTQLHFPFMQLGDRVLNAICALLIAIMVLCGWVAVHHLSLAERKMAAATAASSRSNTNSHSSSALSQRAVTISGPDLTILVSVVLFFSAFFLALFTQYRAEVTLFRACSRFWATNRNWRIREYAPERDITRKREAESGAEEGGSERKEHQSPKR